MVILYGKLKEVRLFKEPQGFPESISFKVAVDYEKSTKYYEVVVIYSTREDRLNIFNSETISIYNLSNRELIYEEDSKGYLSKSIQDRENLKKN